MTPHLHALASIYLSGFLVTGLILSERLRPAPGLEPWAQALVTVLWLLIWPYLWVYAYRRG